MHISRVLWNLLELLVLINDLNAMLVGLGRIVSSPNRGKVAVHQEGWRGRVLDITRAAITAVHLER